MDKLYIGIRAEDKSYWERRTPIPPHDCKYIMEKVLRFYLCSSIQEFKLSYSHQIKEFSQMNNI